MHSQTNRLGFATWLAPGSLLTVLPYPGYPPKQKAPARGNLAGAGCLAVGLLGAGVSGVIQVEVADPNLAIGFILCPGIYPAPTAPLVVATLSDPLGHCLSLLLGSSQGAA
jgi:hypothetical protein